ncbi:MAG: class I SAM-dependent methyltransferase [Planctomycetes bacterium]|nr:class I SAM-dependent methyltransferase [Planctomycetota bacterium]
MSTTTHIREILVDLARQYPPALVEGQLSDVRRVAFHISLVISEKEPNRRICDLGGGIGLFSVGCAALGMSCVLADDFGDKVNQQYGDEQFALHKKLGVDIVAKDVISERLDFEPESFDAFTCFDAMEHWHHSPKVLFGEIRQALKPCGLFILGGPNCVNLRKRISAPLGIGKWSGMGDWYEKTTFRGHVREPDVDDLQYIADDMKLRNVRILGRNWLGYHSTFKWVRIGMPLFDHALRLLPSLCSDIYLVGQK